MAFPEWHYPDHPCPHSKMRMLFASLGITDGLDVKDKEDQSGITFVPQRCSQPTSRLCATSPAVPLLPPNPVDVSWDPCLSDSKELRHELQNLDATIRVAAGIIRQNDELWDIIRRNVNKPADTATLDKPTDMKSLDDRSRLRRYQRLVKQIRKRTDQGAYIPCVNSAYTGGCLNALNLSEDTDEMLVVSPRGPHMDKLLVEPGHEGEGIKVESAQSYEMGSRILQVNSIRLQKQVYSVVRMQSVQTAMVVRDCATGEASVQAQCDWTSVPSGVAISPFIAGEHVVALESGQLHMVHPNERCEIVADNIVQRFDDQESWLAVSFAAHPRQLTLADRTGVAVYDIRHSPAESCELFTLPSRYLNIRERVYCHHTLSHSPFHHLIGTDYSLFLMDQRMPNCPILQHSHLLQTAPQYLSDASLDASNPWDSVVLVSSQESCETHCIQLGPTGFKGPPQVLDSPWKLSRPDDMLKLSQVDIKGQPRLLAQHLSEVPLVGMAAVCSRRPQGFRAFQLTSFGDVFYQTFLPGSSDQEKTCAAGPGSRSVMVAPWCDERWKQWAQDIQAMADEKWLNQLEEEKFLVPQEGDTYTIIEPGPVKAAIEDVPFAHVLCPLCMSHLSGQSQRVADLEKGSCHACGLSLKQGRQLQSIRKQGKILPPEVMTAATELMENSGQGCIDPTFYPDAESQILNALWKEDEGIDLQELLLKRDIEMKSRKAQRRARFLEKKEKGGKPAKQTKVAMEEVQEEMPESPTVDETDGETSIAEQAYPHQETKVESSGESVSMKHEVAPTHSSGESVSMKHEVAPTHPSTSGTVQSLLPETNPKMAPVSNLQSTQHLPESSQGTGTMLRQRWPSTCSLSSITSLESLAPGFLNTPPRLRKEHAQPASPVAMDTLFSPPKLELHFAEGATASPKKTQGKSGKLKTKYAMGF